MSEEKYKFVIPANSAVPVNATGNRLYCEAATDVFFINVEGVQDYEMKAKRSRVLSTTLTKFFLENRTNVPNAVELHIGFEEVHDNEVKITGAIDNDVKVVNPAGQNLNVADAMVFAKVETVRAELNQIKDISIATRNNSTDGKSLRASLTTLQGAAHAQVANANTELVSAAANTKGIIIRRMFWTKLLTATTASQGWVRAGANLIEHCWYDSTLGMSGRGMLNTFIPAGQSLSIETNSAVLAGIISYEVLT